MKRIAIILVAALAMPAAAQQPQPALSLEQRMLLRCSAAFAIVAGRQDKREPRALAYPALRERGREYFARAGARLMDEARLDRPGIADLFAREATALQGSAADDVMPACLAALDASGL